MVIFIVIVFFVVVLVFVLVVVFYCFLVYWSDKTMILRYSRYFSLYDYKLVR